MFRSYESGRDGYITFIADYIPFQEPWAGPNYYQFDPNAVYEIKIDNVGDGNEHIAFQFRFTNAYQKLALPVGGASVPVPLINIGPFGPGIDDGDQNKNLVETYTVAVAHDHDGNPHLPLAMNLATGGYTFRKPLDNIGNKSIADYPTYANNHIFPIGIPGCDPGRVFVGQRKDPFAVNVGEIFDLVNLNPLGSSSAEPNALAAKNITSIALEVPIACVVHGEPVIGAWQTVSIPKNMAPNMPTSINDFVPDSTLVQVSRLGMPLVNEAVIGLPDKDKFNSSMPSDDAQFLTYVKDPTLPAILQVLFNVHAPATPRTDLISAFLTGIPGLNQPAHVTPSEMLRLNTSIPPVAASAQNTLGVLGGDKAGFPNGRRPGDDVVDITLRVAMGVLLPASQAPDGQLPYTDGTPISAADFAETFPYINPPLPGSPNGANGLPAGSGTK